jgi:hypothetical protein
MASDVDIDVHVSCISGRAATATDACADTDRSGPAAHGPDVRQASLVHWFTGALVHWFTGSLVARARPRQPHRAVYGAVSGR